MTKKTKVIMICSILVVAVIGAILLVVLGNKKTAEPEELPEVVESVEPEKTTVNTPGLEPDSSASVVFSGNGKDTVDYTMDSNNGHSLAWNQSKYRREKNDGVYDGGKGVSAPDHAMLTYSDVCTGESASLMEIMNEELNQADDIDNWTGSFTIRLSDGSIWCIYWNMTESYARYLCPAEEYLANE
ncbi:MAG: hypothetical protein NC548_10945 [Lachnospiraceae bacterium]|nr:hypothetical protein [Lachnospiraceae bacterium]MCM1233824.1 hypothetical protein [Ruminococcus flavefaciens]